MRDIILIGAGIGKVYSSCSEQSHHIEVVEQKEVEIKKLCFCQSEPFVITNNRLDIGIHVNKPKHKGHQRPYKYHP